MVITNIGSKSIKKLAAIQVAYAEGTPLISILPSVLLLVLLALYSPSTNGSTGVRREYKREHRGVPTTR